jgi:ribose/xylose/arabinose/galactoside ABC-type transport system permease subunit
VIFAVLQNGVQLLGINQFWLQAVTGAAILGTVIFYSLLTRRAERVERAARRQPVGLGIATRLRAKQ